MIVGTQANSLKDLYKKVLIMIKKCCPWVFLLLLLSQSVFAGKYDNLNLDQVTSELSRHLTLFSNQSVPVQDQSEIAALFQNFSSKGGNFEDLTNSKFDLDSDYSRLSNRDLLICWHSQIARVQIALGPKRPHRFF